MAKLDTTRNYATIFNDDQGRAFQQDGKFFGANGAEWIDPAAAAPAAPVAAPAKPPKGKAHKVEPAPVDDQLAAQLGGAA
jgi:hypothetical protein